jgi:hypothetical protein
LAEFRHPVEVVILSSPREPLWLPGVLNEVERITGGAFERAGFELVFTVVDRMAGGAFSRDGFMLDLMDCPVPAGVGILPPDIPLTVAVTPADRVWGSILEKRPWLLSRK